jgi:uncharacterized protein YdgA (DUF945 family)
MSHRKLVPGALLAVVGILLGAAPLYIGHRVEAEVAQLAHTLAARGDVEVTRLTYARRFLGGTVHYDLTWRPLADDADIQALRSTGLLSRDGLHLAGVLEVRHGPWTGRGGHFALASSEGAVPLPPAWHPLLPDHPAGTPVLQANALLRFGGQLESHFLLADYRGRIFLPEAEMPLHVELEGLEVMLGTSTGLDRLMLELRMHSAALAMGEAPGAVRVGVADLLVEADMEEARPWVWTGTSQVELARLAFSAPGHQLVMSDVRLESDTSIEQGRLHATTTTAVGATSFDDYHLQSGEIVLALRGLDVAAVSALAELSRRVQSGADASTPDEQLDRLLEILQQMLAGGPALAIDALRIAVHAPGDLSGRLGLSLEQGIRLSPIDPVALAMALRVEAELKVSKAFLQHVATLTADAQLPGGGETERRLLGETLYAGTMAQFQATPFLAVTEHHVAATAILSQGSLQVGGSELMDIEALLTLALALAR